jgi:hypothetical protein
MTEPMDAVDVVKAFQARQDAGDLEGCLALVADDAAFDVGRGRYQGKEQIRRFLETVLFPIHTRTEGLVAHDLGEDRVSVVLTLSDDNTRRFNVPPIQVQGEYTVRRGKILALQARPTAESLETVRTIQAALAREPSSGA